MDKRLKNIEDAAKAVLLNNRRIVNKKGVEYGFTCPAPEQYHWQWLWDSCFHAIALRWVDPEFAKKEIISLLSGQWSDGRIPNMVHIRHNWRFDRIVHGTGRDTSGITQPPIVADAVLRVYETTGDRAFLEETYAPLKLYYDWLHDCRETNHDGLIAMYHPWETGIDNSPRWDDIFQIKNFSRKAFDLTKGLLMFKFNFVRYNNEKMRRVSPYFVKGIDMNCYYYKNQADLAQIATILGRSEDAAEMKKRAEVTREAVSTRMWDPEQGVFIDLIGEDERKSYVPTVFEFMPVWAGIADEDQAREAHKKICDKQKYWGAYPVTTTAIDYKEFDPNGYWRGTIWVNTNWFMIEGLAKYGYTDTANLIKEKTLQLIEKSGFREYYNPLTGEGGGPESFGWSTLVIDLIHRDF